VLGDRRGRRDLKWLKNKKLVMSTDQITEYITFFSEKISVLTILGKFSSTYQPKFLMAIHSKMHL
jgi:hypothetical protein